MFIEPMRSMVPSKSKPWNMPEAKCARASASWNSFGWFSRRCSAALNRKPQVPQAGSQMTSFGVGAVISTMRSMMWRGVRNWPFLPGAGDLAQHVFVEVALGVAILHRQVGDEVDDLGEQRRRRDGEARSLHVGGVGRALLAHGTKEGKDVFGDDGEHLRRSADASKLAPAHVGIGDTAIPSNAVLARRKDGSLGRFAGGGGLSIRQELRVIETAHEQEVRDLLDYLDRIGDAASPEGVPHGVDLAAKLARQHHNPVAESRRSAYAMRAPS